MAKSGNGLRRRDQVAKTPPEARFFRPRVVTKPYSINSFIEILNWRIPSELQEVALNCVIRGDKCISKSTVLLDYGQKGVDQCPYFFSVKNPHYKSAAPMQLYFRALIEALGVEKREKKVRKPSPLTIAKKQAQLELKKQEEQARTAEYIEFIEKKFGEGFNLDRFFDTKKKISKRSLCSFIERTRYSAALEDIDPNLECLSRAFIKVKEAVYEHNRPFVVINNHKEKIERMRLKLRVLKKEIPAKSRSLRLLLEENSKDLDGAIKTLELNIYNYERKFLPWLTLATSQEKKR